MKIWGISNPMLLIWGLGYIQGLWDGSLSIWALVAMYLIFTVTNLYGLWIKEK
jgi:hypothetical protein